MIRFAIAILALCCAVSPVAAQSTYERHVVFDNARGGGGWFYAPGAVVAPSALELDGGKAPVETTTVHSPPNALRLKWTSRTGGDWRVTIAAQRMRGIYNWPGDALSFWLWSENVLDAGNSPRLMPSDATGASLPTINLIGSQPLPARRWVKVVLPFSAFTGLFEGTEPNRFDPAKLARLLILQGLDDGRPQTLYIDDIRVEDAATADRIAPDAPAGLTAHGYDRHVELRWRASQARDVEAYRIYRAEAGGGWQLAGIQRDDTTRYMDWLGASGRRARYRVTAIDSAGNESATSAEAIAATRALSDDALLTMVQEAQFRFYWDGAHPVAGMGIEVWPGDPDQVALGGSGFGISALVVGIERGFVSRAEGVARLLKIVRFLKRADRYHGVWPHFLNGNTGRTMAVFGRWDDGGDVIETAFLMQGLLTARQYVTRDTPAEREIRETITGFWRTIEWDWYRKSPDSDFLYWHWSPTVGYRISHPLIGWNEALIAYLLAIASPTHAVPASLWHSGWAGQSPLAVQYRRNWSRTTQGDHYVNGNSYYGIKLDVGVGSGAELFFGQFSFLGFDPRGMRDRYTNYFANNRNIARIAQAYAIDNPRGFKGYGADAWGRSAGVNAMGGRSLPADDNGTLTIHAALGAMPYTPAESMRALKHYYRDLGDRTWGTYGFIDGFNETENWHDETYMALNQAQTVAMIENHRSGLLWRLFMANPEIAPALDKIGFVKD